jgi:hypothetical protein
MVLLTLSYSVSSPVAVLSGLVEWGHVGGLVGCLGWFQTKDRGGEGGGGSVAVGFPGAQEAVWCSLFCGWCHGIELCLVSVAALADSSGKAREDRLHQPTP